MVLIYQRGRRLRERDAADGRAPARFEAVLALKLTLAPLLAAATARTIRSDGSGKNTVTRRRCTRKIKIPITRTHVNTAGYSFPAAMRWRRNHAPRGEEDFKPPRPLFSWFVLPSLIHPPHSLTAHSLPPKASSHPMESNAHTVT